MRSAKAPPHSTPSPRTQARADSPWQCPQRIPRRAAWPSPAQSSRAEQCRRFAQSAAQSCSRSLWPSARACPARCQRKSQSVPIRPPPLAHVLNAAGWHLVHQECIDSAGGRIPRPYNCEGERHAVRSLSSSNPLLNKLKRSFPDALNAVLEPEIPLRLPVTSANVPLPIHRFCPFNIQPPGTCTRASMTHHYDMSAAH